MKRILLTCAGTADLTAVIRDFAQRRDIELFTADASPEGRLSSVTDRWASLPPGDAPTFVDELFALAVRQRIEFIIPKSDEEVFALMNARERFEQAGIQLAIQDNALLPILQSKSACYEHLASKGFPVPPHRVVRTTAELDLALQDLDYPSQPVLMKPDSARGGRGVCVIATSPSASDEAINVFPPSFAAQLLDGTTPYILMKYERGIIYDIDILKYANGDVFFGARGRFSNVTKNFSGNFFTTDEKLLDFSRRCYEALPTSYLIDYDIFVTESGEIILLEVNPRPSGSTVSYLPFGTNLFYTLAKSHLDGEHLPIIHPPHQSTAIVCFDLKERRLLT